MAKKSKAEVKPEIEPQINETETTPEVEENPQVQQPVETIKETKKVNSKIDFISNLVEKKNPRFCLHSGLGDSAISKLILSTGKSIEKYLIVDTKIDEKSVAELNKSFESVVSKSSDILKWDSKTFQNEFPSSLDFFILDLSDNTDEELKVLEVASNHMSILSKIVVFGYSKNEITKKACDGFVSERPLWVAKEVQGDCCILTLDVGKLNSRIFRAPSN